MVRFELTVQIGRSRQSCPHRASSSQSRSRSRSHTRHSRPHSPEDRIPLVERVPPPARDDDPASISLPPSPTDNTPEKTSLPLGPRSSHQHLPTSNNESLPNGPPPADEPPGLNPRPKQNGSGSYTDFSPLRRKFILSVITIAGFFGPLAGGIYLPALPVLEKEFNVSPTAINVTVSVFMMTFAFGVSLYPPQSHQQTTKMLMSSTAAILVHFCRLEGSPSIVLDKPCHLHLGERASCCSTSKLRSTGVFEGRAGVWQC